MRVRRPTAQLYMKKYESLVSESYKEPVGGRFEDATTDILSRINADRGSSHLSNYTKFRFFAIVYFFARTKISVIDASR